MGLAEDNDVHAFTPDRPHQPSTGPFCQGEAGALACPGCAMARIRPVTAAPLMQSRSRIM
jgi:hypothetical protein